MPDTSVQEAAYDAVLYPDTPHFWSEPSRFAAAAVLHGFLPAEVRSGRILEIGCARGANIIPIAARYPLAQCYGFDISGKQIEAAQKRADEVGLSNLTLLHADILNLPEDLGTFDFIIAHGISSWVPPDVRIGVWQLCNRLLRENGLLYLSYNTLPGWHFKRVVRDLLRFHMRDGAEIHEADAVTSFFHRVDRHAQGIYKRLLGIEKQFMNDRDANYVRHEYLEEENHAFYVQDFLGEGEAYGFTYVCEADPTSSNLQLLVPEVAEAIARDARGDRRAIEQYVDFYINRAFRSSVFARNTKAAMISPEIDASAFERLHVVPVDIPPSPRHYGEGREFLALSPDFFAPSADVGRTTRQQMVITIFNTLKAALPATARSLRLADILAQLPSDMRARADASELARLCTLEYLYRREFAVSTEAVAWSYDTAQPRLQELIRSDASHRRAESAGVLHEKITLTSDRSRAVMALLDGTRNQLELERRLVALSETGDFDLPEDAIQPEKSMQENVASYLTAIVEKIAQLKLLY